MLNNGIIGPKTESSYYDGRGMVHVKRIPAYLERGRWYFPASVNVNATSFAEGETISITLNTSGLPDGTNLFWSVNTLSGTTLTTADLPIL